ncbi:hypothetical protein PILCRDRAFT_83051 [Piloderma croceum F 1598]|uniref:Uncharacterized protein n=1 Tax=Piloderma croceum (strain F 1598) TaxID=765440 RepID=A0A0C3B1R3_PILCF|nr:hypothetical protein PILCRDRAFT_83051 [Piloderma croceum F 1598]
MEQQMPPPVVDVVKLFRDYPFSTDEMYQQGLASIVADGVLEGKTETEKEVILRKTELFYFNRITGHALTLENICETDPTTTSASAADESRTLTFAELKDLIEEGKTDQIPNNKYIPEAINEAPPSESQAPSRKKPWEIAAE